MQPLYTTVKVNNEIELCEVTDLDCKKLIERELLKNRISYYIRWPKDSFFNRNKNVCIICVNDMVRDDAETIVRSVCDESGHHVKFLMKKSSNSYLQYIICILSCLSLQYISLYISEQLQ